MIAVKEKIDPRNFESKKASGLGRHPLDLWRHRERFHLAATRVIGLRDGEIVYRGTREEIRAMTDEEFKEIYGKEAVRVGVGLQGEVE